MDRKTVYVLLLEWAFDGENGVSCEVYDNYELAHENFEKWIHDEQSGTWIAHKNNVIEEKSKDHWEAYIEGFYGLTHTSIEIIKQTVITKEG